MKKALSIALKDLKVLRTDKGGLFWILGFPVVFALLFGAIFSDANSGDGSFHMQVAVVDEDQSELSAQFITELDSQDNITLRRLPRQEATDLVRTGKVTAAVILKPGFGESNSTMFNMNDSGLELEIDPSRKMSAGYLQGIIAKVRMKTSFGQFNDPNRLDTQIPKWQDKIDSDPDINPQQALAFKVFFAALKTFARELDLNGLESGFSDNLFEFDTVDIERQPDKNSPATAFQITCPQAMIWAVMSCSLTFAVSIIKERQKGTYQRLRVGPVSRFQILGGKALACCLACFFVELLLVVLAILIFKMPIHNYFFLIVGALCTIFSFVGIMTFASTVCKTEQAIHGAAWAIIMVMAMIGGGMMPLLFMPGWMQKVSNFSIVKWSIYALEGGIWRDLSFFEFLMPCGLLIGIGALFFGLGFLLLKRAEA